jgi:hypothetical protein
LKVVMHLQIHSHFLGITRYSHKNKAYLYALFL